MTRRRLITSLLVLLAVLLALWLWIGRKPNAQRDTLASSTPSAAQVAFRQSPQPAPTTAAVPQKQEQMEKRKQVVKKVITSLNTPITFYGKVVDQHGEPVPDANVGYSALDKFMASGSDYTGKSDANGLFEINGIKGARLSVNVRKEGYYFIDGKSHAAFAYASGPDGVFLEPPSKDNPAVFVLQKMGEAEVLIHFEKDIRVSRDGKPTQISLHTGQSTADGDLKVEAWTEDQNAPRGESYNWRCRISVPGGGLVERKGQFDFEAPEEGYRPADEIVMPQTTERWQKQASRDYFLKLANNRYARISFTMRAGGEHFFTLTSHLNPTPGNRNLEFKPQ